MDSMCNCPGCGLPNYLSAQRLAVADDQPIHCWKCDVFIDHAEVALQPTVLNRFQHLTGRPVEMTAAGILYRGVFVEMTEEDVKLRGKTGWIIIDVMRVTRIVDVANLVMQFDERKHVEASFYEVSDLQGSEEESPNDDDTQDDSDRE